MTYPLSTAIYDDESNRQSLPDLFGCRCCVWNQLPSTIKMSESNAIESINDDAAVPQAPSQLRRFSIKLLRIIGLGYATILVALVVLETRLVYPGAYMETGYVQPNNRIQTVRYTNSDGLKIAGRLLHQATDKPIVLYFHGNGEKAVWLDPWLIRLAEAFDANVMAAEYRGFGDDDQTPAEAGVLDDSFAARNFLMERYNVRADEIILYGCSLGGGCAVAVAADGGAKAIVLERTFDRMVDIAAGQYPFIPVNWLMRNRYDSISRLQNYQGPLVQLHGTTDELIPVAHAKRLFDSSPSESKQWIEVARLGHNDALPTSWLKEIAKRMMNK